MTAAQPVPVASAQMKVGALELARARNDQTAAGWRHCST
jgi:hypothetical protein